MSDKEKVVILERIGSDDNIIKMKFTKELLAKKSTLYIVAAFNKCFQHGYKRIIIDMAPIKIPQTNFIATLIEATSKVRRKDGDIKIINLSDEAKQAIAGFSAYSFLSIVS